MHIHKKDNTETETKTGNRTDRNITTALERSVMWLKSILRAKRLLHFLEWFKTCGLSCGSRNNPQNCHGIITVNKYM